MGKVPAVFSRLIKRGRRREGKKGKMGKEEENEGTDRGRGEERGNEE